MINNLNIHVYSLYVQLIQNRIQFYLNLYKGVSIWGSLLMYIFISFLLFQENQILGCSIILFHIHFTRKDITLLKIAYGDKYLIAIIFDYFLIYLSFVILGLFTNDYLIYYSPIIFALILFFFFRFPKANSIYNNKLMIFCAIVSSTDFIWKSGVRAVELKLWIIYLIAIPLMIGTRNPYIFSIFLFCIGLIINRFYNIEISEYLLDIINTHRKHALKYILRQNLFTYFKITFVPVLIFVILFYSEKHFLFIISSYFVIPILIFQFLLYNIKTFKESKSSTLLQMINGFSTLCILFPPLSLGSLVNSLLVFKNMKRDAEN